MEWRRRWRLLEAEAQWPAVSPPSSVFSSSFAVFFFLSFSSRLFSSFSSLLSSLFSLSLGLSLLFCSRSPFFFPFPCFYRQKQGRETWMGWPLCCRPSTVRPTRGKWLVSWRLLERRRRLFEGWMAVTEEGNKSPSSLVSRVQGKKKMVSFQNSTVSSFLLLVFFW